MTFKAVPAFLWTWRWRVLVGAGVIALLATFGPTLLLGPRVAVETAVRRDIVQTVGILNRGIASTLAPS